jgi:hypothetical protein
MNPPRARIYQPAKTAMQSGKGKDSWVLEYLPTTPAAPDSLMGWNSMRDTELELSLKFDTKEQAIAFAKAKQLEFEIALPQVRKTPPKAYAANFSFARRRAYAEDQ